MELEHVVKETIQETNFGRGITQQGLTPLNWGLDRFVFRITVGSYQGKVLKVARKQRAIDQNRKEARTWQTVRNQPYGKYFCPILLDASDTTSYEYLLMEAATTPVAQEDREHVRAKLEEDDIPLADTSRGNFGYYGETPVLLDYPAGQF